jgi:hypothetical protein
LRRSFCTSVINIYKILIRKSRNWAKTNMIFGISTQNWVCLCAIQAIFEVFFSLKICPYSPSGVSQKRELLETLYLLSRYALFCNLMILNNFWTFLRVSEYLFDEVQFLANPCVHSKEELRKKFHSIILLHLNKYL